MKLGKLKVHKGFDELYIYCGVHRIADIPRTGSMTDEEREANAERIVNCWNSHEDLLAALEKYGEHRPDCAVNAAEVCDEFEVMGCTCGLEEAIA